eukprot:TRINITY_DN1447_c0_g1_i2.p1 TRINITY_DN1447_c0_g1~~TRINITY_DN1447_c0_g1_i2.p1  ORF type:complete len:660 (-),score=76.37 TRINITY_DN1447_c0_g1_i2:471-2450(-)
MSGRGAMKLLAGGASLAPSTLSPSHIDKQNDNVSSTRQRHCVVNAHSRAQAIRNAALSRKGRDGENRRQIQGLCPEILSSEVSHTFSRSSTVTSSARKRASLFPSDDCLLHSRPTRGCSLVSCAISLPDAPATTRDAGSNKASIPSSPAIPDGYVNEQDYIKAGGPDHEFVSRQASKTMDQPLIKDKLRPLVPEAQVLDLVVIGCGPAGLSLAAESAKQGLIVGLIGPDVPFVNNYGVWFDEFKELGLAHTIEGQWRDAALYLNETDKPVMVGRPYGRVCRSLLREELLQRCNAAGVMYLDSEVVNILDESRRGSTVVCRNGCKVDCRLVSVASGAASARFLTYEEEAGVGVQTAYGIEVEVESYPYDPTIMHFMDYREYQQGADSSQALDEGAFANIPTFLYAMPLSPTRVFFEETCLAARPAMPFKILKERLHRRLTTLGIKCGEIHEEEWSYIPVGGALPYTTQQHIGFGAAASMIHPATGYSIARSLSEAPHYAASIAAALRGVEGGAETSSSQSSSESDFPLTSLPPSVMSSPAQLAAIQAWAALWPRERKRQRSFMLFGLELILQLDLQATRDFFETFFELPEWLWRGFLASSLSSVDLIWFALTFFVLAKNSMRIRLVKHLIQHPSGGNLVRAYLGIEKQGGPPPPLTLASH